MGGGFMTDLCETGEILRVTNIPFTSSLIRATPDRLGRVDDILWHAHILGP